MEAHTIKLFGKKIQITDKSIFRVEQRKNAEKKPYEGVYSHKDIHKALLFFTNTAVNPNLTIRLIKDGDEYMLLQKK
jgi:hypothetical protein